MSLANQQAALARLLTNKAQREGLRSTHTRPDCGNRPPADDELLLGEIDVDQIELQARALIRKRIGCARHLLSRTQAVLGSKFALWFTKFAESHALRGPQRYEADARRFASFVYDRLDVVQRSALKRDLIDIDLRHSRAWLFFGVFPLTFDAASQTKVRTKIPRRCFIWLRVPLRSKYLVLRLPWTALKTVAPTGTHRAT